MTGPNTIVDAIAAGKKAAVVIERYLKSEMLKQPHVPRLPQVYVEPPPAEAGAEEPAARADTPRAPVEWRRRGFAEVEMSLSAEEVAPRGAALPPLRPGVHTALAGAGAADGAGERGRRRMIELTINGLPFSVDHGSTLLEAATFLGFPIPTLCHMEGLSPYGACRLCVVEVGAGRTRSWSRRARTSRRRACGSGRPPPGWSARAA